jgi:RNA polymerase sigma factor (TIGR02999 family)
MDDAGQVAQLMAELRCGNAGAAEQLVSLFYSELRRIAASKMRSEGQGHTWQPTALVNELYLELRKIRRLKTDAEHRAAEDKTAFLSLAAHIMRRLLIHHMRPLAKRVGRTTLDEDWAADGEKHLDDMESVLSALAAIDPRLRLVVEMKVFGGFSGDEIAQHLGCTPRTVVRHWSFARNFLEQHYSSRDNT